MRFLPVFLDLTQGAVGLAGSGPAAQSKLRLLRSAGARVRWFAEGADAIEDDLAADLHSGGVCRPAASGLLRPHRRRVGYRRCARR
jgi:siroheme synthase (precorrin-2 oxidase/ferrochelatase)